MKRHGLNLFRDEQIPHGSLVNFSLYMLLNLIMEFIIYVYDILTKKRKKGQIIAQKHANPHKRSWGGYDLLALIQNIKTTTIYKDG